MKFLCRNKSSLSVDFNFLLKINPKINKTIAILNFFFFNCNYM